MVRQVIVAVDDSEHAQQACKYYLESIRRDDDQLILANCAETKFRSVNRSVMQSAAPPGGAYGRDSLQEVITASEHEAKTIGDKYTKLFTDAGVKFVFEARFGKPGEEIVKLCDDMKATLVIMGTRGMNRVRRTVLGSVSSYVVNHVSCPVLVVRE